MNSLAAFHRTYFWMLSIAAMSGGLFGAALAISA